MTDQSGIFEIAPATPTGAEDSPWGAIIGCVLMSMLYGTVMLVVYLHVAAP